MFKKCCRHNMVPAVQKAEIGDAIHFLNNYVESSIKEMANICQTLNIGLHRVESPIVKKNTVCCHVLL